MERTYYVYLYEGTDTSTEEVGEDYFDEYDEAIICANRFVKDCERIGKLQDDGNYIWSLNEGERIAIIRDDYLGEDLYMTDIYKTNK